MAEKTATVELLTAEVRVLKVGSRQVTLSVYRQLDWVKHDYIEPFGRVSDSQDQHRDNKHDMRNIYIIGKSKEDGTLVRSYYNLKIDKPWIDVHSLVAVGYGMQWHSRSDNNYGYTQVDGYRVGVTWERGTNSEDTCYAKLEVEHQDHEWVTEKPEEFHEYDEARPHRCYSWHWNSMVSCNIGISMARDDIQRYEAERSIIDEWRELPLIVLAGLK